VGCLWDTRDVDKGLIVQVQRAVEGVVSLHVRTVRAGQVEEGVLRRTPQEGHQGHQLQEGELQWKTARTR
jgi:hypothetical protein